MRFRLLASLLALATYTVISYLPALGLPSIADSIAARAKANITKTIKLNYSPLGRYHIKTRGKKYGVVAPKSYQRFSTAMTRVRSLLRSTGKAQFNGTVLMNGEHYLQFVLQERSNATRQPLPRKVLVSADGWFGAVRDNRFVPSLAVDTSKIVQNPAAFADYLASESSLRNALRLRTRGNPSRFLQAVVTPDSQCEYFSVCAKALVLVAEGETNSAIKHIVYEIPLKPAADEMSSYELTAYSDYSLSYSASSQPDTNQSTESTSSDSSEETSTSSDSSASPTPEATVTPEATQTPSCLDPDNEQREGGIWIYGCATQSGYDDVCDSDASSFAINEAICTAVGPGSVQLDCRSASIPACALGGACVADTGALRLRLSQPNPVCVVIDNDGSQLVVANEREFKGVASVEETTVPIPSECNISVKITEKFEEQTHVLLEKSCQGTAQCPIEFTRMNQDVNVESRIFVHATAANCCVKTLESEMEISNFGTTTTVVLDMVDEGKFEDDGEEVLRSIAFPDVLTVTDVSYNVDVFPTLVNLNNQKLMELSHSIGIEKNWFRTEVMNSAWYGQRIGDSRRRNICLEDINPYQIGMTVQFQQCNLAFVDPERYEVASLAKIPSVQIGQGVDSARYEQWISETIVNVPVQVPNPNNTCCYKANGTRTIDFLQCSYYPETSEGQYQQKAVDQAIFHNKQTCQGYSLQYPGAPMSWNQGGIGDTLTWTNLFKYMPHTFDAAGKLVPSPYCESGTTMRGSCRLAYSKARDGIEDALATLLDKWQGGDEATQATECWIAYQANKNVDMDPSRGGYFYECLEKQCIASGFDFRAGATQPKAPS